MARNGIGDYQRARIVNAVKDKALSGPEISAKLHMCQTSVDRLITQMLAAQPKLLHIESWRDTTRTPVRMIRAGDKPCAKYITKRQRKMMHSRFSQSDRHRDQILELLVMPQTSHQLAARLGLCISSVTRFLREHREAGRVHIKGWILPESRGSQAPVYALGNLPDKPRMRRTREKERRRAPSKPRKIAQSWALMLGA